MSGTPPPATSVSWSVLVLAGVQVGTAAPHSNPPGSGAGRAHWAACRPTCRGAQGPNRQVAPVCRAGVSLEDHDTTSGPELAALPVGPRTGWVGRGVATFPNRSFARLVGPCTDRKATAKVCNLFPDRSFARLVGPCTGRKATTQCEQKT